MDLDKIESVFFNVLEDIKDYLPDITIVGGWLPYIYSNFYWKNFIKNPVVTVDIDLGVDQTITRDYPKTIYQTLSLLNYNERHIQMDRLFPVVLHKERIPVEFITYPNADSDRLEKLVGKQIQINKIEKFEFLLRNSIPIEIKAKKTKKSYLVNCPKPSAFLYHKGVVFIDRENKKKQAKDLYYMYYILRYAPDIKKILKEISEYRKAKYSDIFSENIAGYFERVTSPGILLVEQENGPDAYIADLRQDIFERFALLGMK